MGSSKRTTTESSQSSQNVTPTATPEEQELNKLYLNREKALDPQITAVQKQGLDLSSRLMAGQDLPGYLNTLPGGISKDVQDGIVKDSLRQLNASLSASGAGSFLDSGASDAIGARTAADLYQNASQFNIQNLMQLLSLGVGSGAAVQAPIQGFSSQLSSRLSGLRPVNSSSNSNGTSMFSYNPFLENLYGSAGKTLGSPKVSAGPFSFGG